jgi:hypothetical protein
MISQKRFSVLAALGAAAALASAQPATYDTQTTAIKAGVLLIESQQTLGAAYAASPHVWGQLEQVPGVKPGGWTLVSPLGKTILNQTDFTRWAALGGAPPIGTRLS